MWKVASVSSEQISSFQSERENSYNLFPTNQWRSDIKIYLWTQGETTLLAFIAKYGVPTNQWTWLYEALLGVSMTKIALWIRVCADDWTAESAVKASNALNIFRCDWQILARNEGRIVTDYLTGCSVEFGLETSKLTLGHTHNSALK